MLYRNTNIDGNDIYIHIDDRNIVDIAVVMNPEKIQYMSSRDIEEIKLLEDGLIDTFTCNGLQVKKIYKEFFKEKAIPWIRNQLQGMNGKKKELIFD